MARGPRYKVRFRRRREGKTDYRLRYKLLLSGKPRLVIRKSLRYLTVQIIEAKPEGDRVICSAHSKELRKLGWKGYCSNLPAAYLTGLLCGLRGISKGIREVVLDMGLYPSVKGSKIYAALKGVIDAGLDVPHDGEVLPEESRIRGEHISSYAELLGEESKKRFSHYFDRGLDPKDLPKHFDEIKEKILESFEG